MAIVYRSQRGYSVHQKQGRVAGTIRRLAYEIDPAHDPGRGLVMHDGDGFIGMPAILGKPFFESLWIDSMTPVARNEVHDQAKLKSDISP
jgi:hypothetical protein